MPAVLVCAISAGCVHIDASKYEQLYFSKTAKMADENAQVTPEATVPAVIPAATQLKAATPAAGAAAAPAAVSAQAKQQQPAAVTKTAAVEIVPALSVTPSVKKPKRKFKVKELVINSDSMTFNKETSEAVFTGSVEASADNVLIRSDRLRSKNYKDNAVAEGNVTAYYKDYGIYITCETLDYGGKLSNIIARKNVVAKKALDNGNTITMRSDIFIFNADDDTMLAKKDPSRVRVTMQDIMAFGDEVKYNNETRQLEISGAPFIKKGKSLFFSDNIKLDVDKKTIKMNKSIWTKLFYRDFEKESGEAVIERDKNATPR